MTEPEKVSPLILERYELKYLIPKELIEPMSVYLENLGCYLDKYADESKTYIINSLYLDTPNYLFLEKKERGDEPRFNMRIRCYGTNPVPPYYIEVKIKQNGIVRKLRHPIDDHCWKTYFAGDNPCPFSSEMEANSKHYPTIERLVRTYNVEPKILTQYRRKAYLSAIDEYARVTFDCDLRFQRMDRYELTPNDAGMQHYDNPMHFPDGANVVLELKCPTRVPLWMLDFIRIFDLQRGSFSKYYSSSLEPRTIDGLPRLTREVMY